MSVAAEIQQPARGLDGATGRALHGDSRSPTTGRAFADARATGSAALTALIAEAVQGDQRAWTALVARYSPLVNAVARQFRLGHADAADLGQMLWLRVFEHLHELRVPEALPGWISSTARREAMRMTNASSRTQVVDPVEFTVPGSDPALGVEELGVEEIVLRADCRRAVRNGLAELGPEHRRLLSLLFIEPRLTYQQISSHLGIPLGSVGPNRSRCLRRLANTTAVRALLS